MAGLTTFLSGGGGGPDLTLGNSSGILYIRGSEFVNESLRLIVGNTDQPVIQRRLDGVWNATDIELDSSSLRLGRGFRLGAASNHLIIKTEPGNQQIVVTADFDDSGSRPPHSEILGPLLTRLVVQPDESVEFTLTDHLSSSIIQFDAFTEAVYFKAGSVGATADVVLTNSSGVPPNDFVFRELNLPASTFPANTEVRIEFEASTAFAIGEQVNTRLISANPFSMLHNADGSRFWVAVDTRSTRKEDLLSHPTGLDRILTANDGHILSDNAGNLILREAA